MKYFMDIENLELNVKGYPNAFPILWLITSEEKDEINRLMIEATTNGFHVDIKSLVFGRNLEPSFALEKVFQKMDSLSEIDKNLYDILNIIPHWNPFEDTKKLLKKYLDFINNIDDGYTSDFYRDIDKIIKEVEEARDVRLYK